MATIQCITPVDGSVYVERETASAIEIQTVLSAAVAAQKLWKKQSVAERQALCTKAVNAFVGRKNEIGEELSWQMGPYRKQPVKWAGSKNEHAT
jgi:acyl-CoA reductase-like NAD-dependent aldehyde dehydrogenase